MLLQSAVYATTVLTFHQSLTLVTWCCHLLHTQKSVYKSFLSIFDCSFSESVPFPRTVQKFINNILSNPGHLAEYDGTDSGSDCFIVCEWLCNIENISHELWRLPWWWSCINGVTGIQTSRGKQFVSCILWRPRCAVCCKLYCFFQYKFRRTVYPSSWPPD